MGAERFLNFINSQTGLNINFTRPPDYTKLISFLIGLTTWIVMCYTFWDTVKLVILGKGVWAFFTLVRLSSID